MTFKSGLLDRVALRVGIHHRLQVHEARYPILFVLGTGVAVFTGAILVFFL
jgi:hypothetical protein